MNNRVGTVSYGTTREQDLIPTFLDELEKRDPQAYAELKSTPFGSVPEYVEYEGEESAWWYSEEATYLLTDLFDALDECAPEGYYFGAHPGDGSDYGYWEN